MSDFYGTWYKIVRFTGRLLIGCRKAPPCSEPDPVIFVCRHLNMHGPIHAMACLPSPVHIWVFSPFTRFRTCFRQFRDYTFHTRFGWPKGLSAAVAAIAAGPISRLFHSMRAIPVYRGQMELAETYRTSLDALLRGESLLICPDMQYDSESFETGTLYTGYLHLAHSYRSAVGRQLPIVPVYCPYGSKTLVYGKPVLFSEDLSFHEDRDRVAEEIRLELDRLALESEG